MIKGLRALKQDAVLNEIAGVSKETGARVYLVGGVLRNLALGRRFAPDYDFAIDADVEEFSSRVAERFSATSFLLDKDAPSYRVAVRSGGMTLDFSPIKGGGIIEDLKKRDFTVNAMGLDILSLAEGKEARILDPCAGERDAGEKMLRAASEEAFDEDPLRTLRAIRLSGQYGLEIERATMELIKKKAALLSGTSAERIRDELILIFSSDGTSKSIEALFDTGIIDAIIPEIRGWGDVSGYNLLAHALKTLDMAQALLSGASEAAFPGAHSRLTERFKGRIGPIGKAAFFKMAAFFHDAGKPSAMSREEGRLRFTGHDLEGGRLIKEVFRRLKFSRRFITELANIVKNHHRVFMLAGLGERSARAKGHLFRAAGKDAYKDAGIDLLLLALCDARATRGGEDEGLLKVVREMLDFYYAVYTRRKPRALLDGNEIMRTFNVPEGSMVGEIMDRISQGVESGRVRNKKEAAAYVKDWLKKRG